MTALMTPRTTKPPKARIRGLLFDKDGTLLDYARTWVPINREVALFAARGDPDLANELLALGGHDPATDIITPGSVLAAGSHDEVADVFASRLAGETPPRLPQSIERIFREGGARHAVAIQGAALTLEPLAAAGFVLGVATNDSAGGLAASLERSGLADYFSFGVGCDSGYGAKPEPGMALAFCDAARLEPEACAVIGDAVHDLEMGVRASFGLCIGVLSGTSGRADLLPQADVLLDSIRDLPDLDILAA
jgi:phosphoglycolate phosphatase